MGVIWRCLDFHLLGGGVMPIQLFTTVALEFFNYQRGKFTMAQGGSRRGSAGNTVQRTWCVYSTVPDSYKVRSGW